MEESIRFSDLGIESSTRPRTLQMWEPRVPRSFVVARSSNVLTYRILYPYSQGTYLYGRLIGHDNVCIVTKMKDDRLKYSIFDPFDLHYIRFPD